jgi:transposase-like protein
MHCIRCGSEATRNDGQTRLGGQRWRCNGSGRRFTARSRSAFARHGFPEVLRLDIVDNSRSLL